MTGLVVYWCVDRPPGLRTLITHAAARARGRNEQLTIAVAELSLWRGGRSVGRILSHEFAAYPINLPYFLVETIAAYSMVVTIIGVSAGLSAAVGCRHHPIFSVESSIAIAAV